MMESSAPAQPGVPNLRQLAETAAQLGIAHRESTGTPRRRRRRRRSLAPLVSEAGPALSKAYDTFARAAAEGAELGAGAHWIVDNFYVLRDQRSETLRHLRSPFFHELPHLVSGPYRGFPRIYHVALSVVRAVDHAVDAENLEQFLRAYQRECPLTLAELWAMPDVLRVVLLADLQDLSSHVLSAYRVETEAKKWADRIRRAGDRDPMEGAWEARSLAHDAETLSDALIQSLLEHLQGDAAAGVVCEWLERQLTSRETSVSDLARSATQRHVSISHAVSALRWTASARWERIVEAVSLTEEVLRRDPAGIYPRMDIETRDRYRHAVEDLARRAPISEIEVAEAAIDRCEQGVDSDVARHVGYHLVGPDREALAASIGSRPTLAQRMGRLAKRHPLALYLSSVALITLGSEWAILGIAELRGVGVILLGLVLATAFLPCVDLAIALSHRIVAWSIRPRRLPKLDAELGLSTDHRTLVVVPALLTSPNTARALVEAIEVHAYANPSPLLRFALLSDFGDGNQAKCAEDDRILSVARNAIRALNDRHRDAWGDRFFLLHRERKWNAAEGVWMGWERKRGKIEELNALLLDSDRSTTFSDIEGDFSEVCGGGRIRYVITLDADTRMPPNAALDLVRTAAHPLNRPRHDPRTGRVIDGYGILQPRISIAPRSASRSRFARIFSGIVGLDPYTTAVSDLYQDLFGEGIYTGKGLYDVKAFTRALHGVIPENTVLSHDLLESTFARAGLVTDIELYDDYPGGFLPFIKRLHRWVRGDWQILPWLFSHPRGADGHRRPNPLPLLGRWEILDNIRRSVTGPAMLLFLLAGWVALPRSPLFWTGVALAILAFPIYVNLTAAVFARPTSATWVSYLKGVVRDFRRNLLQTGVTITFLAASALYTVDAIARALWRMLVTRRRMLEWETAHDVERRSSASLAAHWRAMWPSAAWAFIAFVLVTTLEPRAWIAASPFVSAWVVAPWAAWWLSRPARNLEEELSLDDQAFLRRVGRATWSYFARHVGPQTRWLAPDNVQEDPFRGVAPRTSPTNIGLGLVATRCAEDFGWIGSDQGLARLERAVEAIDGLESFHGHLFNWYNTRTGDTLWPRYVSTVDSGNFVASLIVLEQALRNEGSLPWPSPAWAEGLRNSIGFLRNQLGTEPSGPGSHLDEDRRRELAALTSQLEIVTQPADSTDVNRWLRVLDEVGNILDPQEPTGRNPEADYDLGSPFAVLDDLRAVVASQRAELAELLPWWHAGEAVPDSVSEASSLDGLVAGLTRVQSGDRHAARALDALRDRQSRRTQLAEWCARKVRETDFAILYDRERELFSIGVDVDRLQLDPNHYDLLASEARLASFIAIALGQVPVTHWFRLGRRATETADGAALLTWGGTAFEALMPLLFMPSWPDTLLDESYDTTVRAQIRYGAQRGRPWGVSESAYNTLNLDLDYQYRAFGVPGLGLKPGLAKDYVVAPYATMLALMVLPSSATGNLKRIASVGGYGAHGYYDAIDYTASRLTPGSDRAVVKSWMAHHQAMSMLALSNVLDGGRTQRRFRASPLVESAELLVQERVPNRIETIDPHPMEPAIEQVVTAPEPVPVVHASVDSMSAPSPRGGLLSNGNYHTLLTQAGTGGSWYKGWQLTRWTPDRVCDPGGVFFYLRDLDSGVSWSATPAPIGLPADRSDTWFHLGKIESALVHDWIESFVEVCVSPEEDIEVRRLTITNYGQATRHIDVTSYAEIVLNAEAADRAHPAFSKLFLETEAVTEHQALLATRRPREHDEERIWLFQTLISDHAHDETPSFEEYETDRERFVGRGRTRVDPVALDRGAVLSRGVGPVLDPVFSMRQQLTLQPGEKKVVSFVMGVAGTRAEVVALADRYDHSIAVQRVIDLATASGPVEARHFGLPGARALDLQAIGVALLYSDPRLRAPSEYIERNHKQQSGLWGYGISGDVPLIVVRVVSTRQMEAVKQTIRAFAYWRFKGIDIDLVFLNQHPPSYQEGLHDLITQAMHSSTSRQGNEFRGQIRVLRADQLPADDLDLLLAVARGVFDVDDLRSPVTESEDLPEPRERRRLHAIVPAESPSTTVVSPATDSDPMSLVADNGFGGFDGDGSYVIRNVSEGVVQSTPCPWVNVVANPEGGFIASESGGGFTWSINSHENRLSPWANDPVVDRPSEVVYIKDDTTGRYGSVTPAPAPLDGEYVTRHGFGYTTFTHVGEGLETQLTLFAAESDALKVFVLTVRNVSGRRRDLSAFHYHEWVLGVDREESARHVVTERHGAHAALLARNRYNQEFASRVAFLKVVAPPDMSLEWTADRESFIGRGCDVQDPVALRHPEPLNGATGARLDPCAAWRVSFALDPDQDVRVAFVLGQASDDEAAEALLERFRSVADVESELARVREGWADRCGRIRVSSPSPAIDHALNGWLLYQTLACRLWGRSALYQSGGAFGFRDQLQDVMALTYVDPTLTRDQILLHAAHQFPEGDVLHWWHPPTGRGVRTRISDDLLWLPFTALHYVETTGDHAILDEQVSFITARGLEEDEHDAYLHPEQSKEVADLYDHCCRALDRSLAVGAHGLPLMGSGDWNDGMNRVGLDGGESVWLGFFLHDILERFAPMCEARADMERATAYRSHAEGLGASLNQSGWDGAWYRRAFYGDGSPLGSQTNEECRIDAIAQAWSILSGVAPPDRARAALDAVERYLVDEKEGQLIRLLTPPFDHAEKDPGYIGGYVPGVRENGGQYTHGILWVIQAFAEVGDLDRALELFEMISPLNHSATREKAERYRVEPYVTVADIYSVSPHVGRGGWTWYTGSAGWMLRVALESILGFTLADRDIRLRPRLPDGWDRYEITYRPSRTTAYHVEVVRTSGQPEDIGITATLDGADLRVVDGTLRVPVLDDGREHRIVVHL